MGTALTGRTHGCTDQPLLREDSPCQLGASPTADERPVLARNRTSQGFYRLSNTRNGAFGCANGRAGDGGAQAEMKRAPTFGANGQGSKSSSRSTRLTIL